MRSLIILKGLSKKQKLDWVKKEGLYNFFLDISLLKRIYYRPDYKGGGREFLTRSFDDLVYRNFIGALCSHLSTGMLVVVDIEEESTVSVEALGTIFGYTIFYHVEPTPIDFIGKNRKYCSPQYIVPSKETLKKVVEEFKREDFSGKILIKSYQDVEAYWKPLTRTILLKDNDRVLHVADLHSHYKILINQVPEPGDYDLAVFHGDYIDGPEINGSRRIINQILNYEGDDRIIFLEGNHELRLRKYLGYVYLRGKQKRIVSEVLGADISEDFMNKTAREFRMTWQEAWDMILKMNEKFKEFIIYERRKERFICTHAGLKWLDQLCPKYVGNVIFSNKNVERVDSTFSANYRDYGIWSIHGHCRYNVLDYTKHPNVINLDAEDENKVNYFINDPNKEIKVCVLKDE